MATLIVDDVHKHSIRYGTLHNEITLNIYLEYLCLRYGDPADPSLVLIYDAAGYIAGTQSGLLKADIDESIGNFANLPVYQVGPEIS